MSDLFAGNESVEKRCLMCQKPMVTKSPFAHMCSTCYAATYVATYPDFTFLRLPPEWDSKSFLDDDKEEN